MRCGIMALNSGILDFRSLSMIFSSDESQEFYLVVNLSMGNEFFFL